MKLLKPLLQCLLFAALLALPPVAFTVTGHSSLLVPKFWFLFTFITGLTLISVATLLVIQRLQPGLYAQAFLVITIVKMLGSMFLALVFVLKVQVNQGLFLVNFFYIYFLNTGFEIYLLLRNLRNQN
ncbi:hypothetical protein A0256_01695 [Mucilaginibacter sp. PAMC 26640]|nr:hypothetical protein A0256_01695 [Mucilaginibacter sp. PAMC 26640]